MTARALLLSLSLLGCGGGGGGAGRPADAAPPPDGPVLVLPDCPEPGHLSGYGAGDALVPLEPRSPLAIVIGFQGFQMARVSLRTLSPLRAGRAVETRVEVAGMPAVSGHNAEIASHAVAGGYQSDEVDLFFNDVPLSELVGLEARIDVRAATEDCRSVASLQVTLEDGTVRARSSRRTPPASDR